HRLLGDGVEHHALDLLIRQRALLFHHLQHMPGDGFTLAVRVGCENQPVGALERLGDVVESAGGLGVDLPDHLKIGVRVDGTIFGGEVADMAERGQNLVGGAQILVDSLGFRRRLHNDDIHLIPMAYGKRSRRVPRDSRPTDWIRTWVVGRPLSNLQMLSGSLADSTLYLTSYEIRPRVE